MQFKFHSILLNSIWLAAFSCDLSLWVSKWNIDIFIINWDHHLDKILSSILFLHENFNDSKALGKFFFTFLFFFLLSRIQIRWFSVELKVCAKYGKTSWMRKKDNENEMMMIGMNLAAEFQVIQRGFREKRKIHFFPSFFSYFFLEQTEKKERKNGNNNMVNSILLIIPVINHFCLQESTLNMKDRVKWYQVSNETFLIEIIWFIKKEQFTCLMINEQWWHEKGWNW